MENIMRNIKIEKIVLSVGGTAEELEKGIKLLEYISKKKAARRISTKRIPTFGVRPKLEVGAVVTLRRNYEDLLRKLFATIDKSFSYRDLAVPLEY